MSYYSDNVGLNDVNNMNLISLYFSYNALSDYIKINHIYIPENSYVNVYIDIKGGLGSLYFEDTRLNMMDGGVDETLTLTKNLLNFLSAIRQHFIINYKCKTRFIIFMESGGSSYHTNIDRKYKAQRQLRFAALDENVVGYTDKIISLNLHILSIICKVIPDCYFIKLKDLEADFIPYYCILNPVFNNNDTSLHLIRSDDKDLSQILYKFKINNIIQIKRKSVKAVSKDYSNKRNRTTVICNKQNAVADILKDYNDKNIINGNPLYYKWIVEFILALAGDSSDGVTGVTGIGPTSAWFLYNALLNLLLVQNEDYLNINNFFYRFLRYPHETIIYKEIEQKIILVMSDIYNIEIYNSKTTKKLFNIIMKVKNEDEVAIRAFRLVSFDALINECKISPGFKEKLQTVDEYIQNVNNLNLNNNFFYSDLIECLKFCKVDKIILNDSFAALYYNVLSKKI